ncbi:MAG: hypothetical protein N2445_01345 [Acidobacteria bacterium]|nr:hypothetical protein [Acidobacteriota bacterium]
MKVSVSFMLLYLFICQICTVNNQASYNIRQVPAFYFPYAEGWFRNPFSYDVFIGNLYYTIDEGETFHPLFNHLATTNGIGLANSIIRDKDNKNIIYMSLFNRTGGPLFAPFAKSKDNGKTLDFYQDDFNGDLGGSNLCQDAAGVLYLITTTKNLTSFNLYRSYDKGENWQKVEIRKGKGIWKEFIIDVIWADPQIPSILYLSAHRNTFYGYEGAFLMSKDGGENWKRKENGIPHNSRGYIKYEFVPQNFAQSTSKPYRIYLIKGNGYVEGNDNLAYSDDRGNSWHCFSMKKDKSQFWKVRVDPKNHNVLYATGSAPLKDFGNPYSYTFYKSSNGGKTWKRAGKLIGEDLIFGDKLTDYYDMAVTESGRIILVGGYGIVVSDDSGETFQIKRKFFMPSVKGLLKTEKGTIVAGAWPFSICSFDNGLTFRISLNHLNWPLFDMENGKLLGPDSICDDTENSLFCERFTKPPGINVLGWVPSLRRIIAIDNENKKFWATDDFGKNWFELGKLPPDSLFRDKFTITKIIVNNCNSNNIIVAGYYIFDSDFGRTFESMDARNGAVFLSEDGGFTWKETLNSGQIGSVVSLQKDKCNPNIVVIGSVGVNHQGGVFVSEDYGNTWERRSEGLEAYNDGNTFLSAVISPVNDGLIYAAVNLNGGIYKSEDWGKHWIKISENPILFDLQFIKEFVYLGNDFQPNDKNFIAPNVISITDILPLEDEKESILISTLSDGLFLLQKKDDN